MDRLASVDAAVIGTFALLSGLLAFHLKRDALDNGLGAAFQYLLVLPIAIYATLQGIYCGVAEKLFIDWAMLHATTTALIFQCLYFVFFTTRETIKKDAKNALLWIPVVTATFLTLYCLFGVQVAPVDWLPR